MKLTAIRIKNFLSISDVELKPGKITQICGANRQGKTSIIKALQFAIKGSGAGSLVKKGEDEAEVILEFDDQTSIRRRINSEGKQQPVKVRKGDFAADKPQGLLDGLFGDGAFNLLSLIEPKKRTEVLLSVIPLQITESQLKEAMGDCPVGVPPIDFTQHGLKAAQQANKYLFQRRAEANKAAKDADEKARVKRGELREPELRFLKDRPEAEIREGIDEYKAVISSEQSKDKIRAAHADRVQAAGNDLSRLSNKITDAHSEVQLLLQKIEGKRKELTELEETKATKLAEFDALKAAKEASGPDAALIADCNKRIQNLMEELGEKATRREYTARVKMAEELEAGAEKAKDFAAKLTGAVERTGQPFMEKLISTAKLPIEGLTFEGDDFKLNGNAIENISGAEALTLALAVARAVAGPAKLICMDGAEALDENSFQQLYAMTEGDGFQYFLSKVGPNFEKRGADDVVVNMSEGNAAVMQ